MTFRHYFLGLSKPDRKNFAVRCGVSEGFLMLVAYGHKSPSTELAVAIEKESLGAVSVTEMHAVFADLLNRAGYVRMPPGPNICEEQ